MRELFFGLVMLLFPAMVHAGCLNEYDSEGTKLGVMYRVEVFAPIGTQVCGEWLDDGSPAMAPNVSRPMSRYCRDIGDDGKIFFAIRLRGAENCDDAAIRYEFKTE